MQTFHLKKNITILIDDEDINTFYAHSWHCAKAKDKFYIRTTIYPNKIKTTIYLHHLILGKLQANETIYFIDGNSFNLQKSNLKIISRSHKNHLNSSVTPLLKSSQFRGVLMRKNKYIASITQNNNRKHIGYFSTEQEAAKAYDSHALQMYGALAKTNFSYTSN